MPSGPHEQSFRLFFGEPTMTIIFDFDGTLADSMDLNIKIYNDLAKKYHFNQLNQSELPELKNLNIKQALQKTGIPMHKFLFVLKEGKEIFQQQIDQIKLFPDIKKTLEKLHQNNIQLGILTSNKQSTVEEFLQNNNMTMFDFVNAEKNLFGKHHSLAKIIKKHDLDKTTTWYVGDEIRDIEASHKADIPIAAVTWGYNSKEGLKKYHPDILIDQPSDLLSLVKHAKL